MGKFLIFVALLVAAYYVVTNYFGFAGPKVVSDAHVAEQVLQQP